ncbi:MAG: hydroxymyristoyl-ACP dehydratase [Paludibacteraceae bacterium]|nr:hydroxymyristoyl-ACP dehydratase [Paludibacteraceae bacterium]
MLIPQRPPIVMVDVVWSADEQSADTGLTIQEDNIFVKDGLFREPGLIEHIAQSAAAFAGYGTFVRGEEPKLGFIGEIKDCVFNLMPPVGSELRTHTQLVTEIGGIRLINAEVRLKDELVATCVMKFFLKDD